MTVSSITGFLSLLILSMGCGNGISRNKIQSDNSINQITEALGQPAYIKFRSFQNSDSTWGFTIFVNSKPYLHHKRIPLDGAESGFKSKEEAEKVAGLFVKMIQEGYANPELNNKLIDSLDIKLDK